MKNKYAVVNFNSSTRMKDKKLSKNPVKTNSIYFI